MDLLNAILNLADAISAGVAVTAFWYNWVVPLGRPRFPRALPSTPDELERFICEAALVGVPDRRPG
jgi:hypothetical protein